MLPSFFLPMFPFLYDRAPESHKGHYGHALLIAGSCGKMGAAILAARACLRSGVGLLTVHVPRCGVGIMQTALPEAMLSVDNDEEVFTSLPADIGRYDALAVGPGLGTGQRTREAFAQLVSQRSSLSSVPPLVIDADGLNILSSMPEMMHAVRHAVLTPHEMEYRRLFADAGTQQMSDLHELFIVRKGHRTTIFAPGLELIKNSSGNPGMATAGSGDVLTGVILSLLAQSQAYTSHGLMPERYEGLSPVEYCQKLVAHAVYLHGHAGDVAASRRPQASLIASDIIDSLLF